ncbi:ATP synthase subunit delta [Sulfurovum lithotrophicum]|uniref:ATP synthase subunit delta n=1 Tax=Sulfurovum lithotrophicum TaxID=206403 RepID=A0A7U4M0A6_9BACT|nr:F0F1 ATP synthase subunit delta [Sulfurovum lithotrophicum]AKF24505.1 ATP synthase subunit delta [Sulfurovum lithotrophicum]
MEELIAKRYATALSSVSQDVQSIVSILNVLTEAISVPEVHEALTSPIVTAEKKTDMILSAIGKEADSTLVNFIKILGENKRLDLIPAIAKVLNADLQKESNQYEGVLKSSNKLGKEELAKLEKTLEKYTGSKIKLKQEKTDLEGLRVSVDDLGIEVNFSKQRVKEQLIDFIKKSL